MIVYKTTNLITKKIYVGVTSKDDPGYLGSGKTLNKAIKKYGKENFVRETLEECYSEKELFEREIFWIKELKSKGSNGYNLTDGGMGILNPTKEVRKKISKSLTGRIQSEETKRKIAEANIGKKYSEETKRKVGQCHIGNKYNVGRIMSPEAKLKNAETYRQKSPEQKLETYKKYYRSRCGKDLTEEQINKSLERYKKLEIERKIT